MVDLNSLLSERRSPGGRQCQEELRNSEENCSYNSKTCDDKLDEAHNRIDAIKQETEKERVMMEASIKRLELECKSWHSKFLDKASCPSRFLFCLKYTL